MNDKKVKLMKPWTAVQTEQNENGISIEVWNRTYIYEKSVLPSKIISNGEKVLAFPIKIGGIENGEEIIWSDPEVFITEADQNCATVVGCAESKAFIMNTVADVEYDGYTTVDLKIMPRGITVQQVFGMGKSEIKGFDLSRLYVEIPIDRNIAELYHFWPFYGDDIGNADRIGNSGKIKDMMLPFKPIVWIGNDEAGFSWCADSDRGWQYKDSAIEIIETAEAVLLRLHLLDFAPQNNWDFSGESEPSYYMNSGEEPLMFRFSFQATPVKPYTDILGQRRSLHIDCFKKVETDYETYLFGNDGDNENCFERMQRLGVNTLYLHEKWNCIQNNWQSSIENKVQIKRIVAEAHRRGIKVLPYFGYEIASNAIDFFDVYDEVKNECPASQKMWYRQPPQRDYIVCYNSVWKNRFVEGIKQVLREYDFDGIYLDGTICPRPCYNEKHGCGYRTKSGELKPTYPVTAIREMMRELFDEIQKNGGIICVHANSVAASPLMAYTHVCWEGETLQYPFYKEISKGIPLDYCRAQLNGRNVGYATEFLVYEHPDCPDWNFKKALSITLLCGILPKPNYIGAPLEIMSGIWDICRAFGMDNAEFVPYWKNEIKSTNEHILCSYYMRKGIGNKRQMLLICSNPTPVSEIHAKVILMKEWDNAVCLNAQNNTEIPISDCSFSISLKAFDYSIINIEMNEK